MKSPALMLAFKFAHAVVFQTHHQVDVFKSFTYLLDQEKFHIIPNGVDVSFERNEQDIEPKKSGSFRVIQVGSVEPRKRPTDLIRAVATMPLDIECIFCGKVFDLDEETKKVISNEPSRYRLLGETDRGQTMKWIESSDVFCLASVSESQPLAVLEAAHLSKPLLLSDLPSYRGLFSHGLNCLLFPPGNIDLIAANLLIYFMSKELRESIGAAAHRRVAPFTVPAFLNRFDAVIKSLVIT